MRILAGGAYEIGIKADGADDLRAARAAGDSIQPGKVLQVLHPAHLVIEQGRMRHVPHLLADVVKLLSPEDRDVAAGRLAEACQGAQQCSFARAVIAENGVEFPAGKFRGDAAQRGKTAKLLD